MPKIFAFVSLLLAIVVALISPLFIFTSLVYAMNDCGRSGVTYTPDAFFVGQEIKITFTFNQNTFNNLKSLQVKRIRVSLKRTLQPALNFDLPIQPSFSITVNDPELQKETSPNPHTGNLYMSTQESGENFQDLCGEISYSVGQISCKVISIPSVIPPGSNIDIQFLGSPNIIYSISYSDQSSRTGFSAVMDPDNKAVTTTTNSSGAGFFSSVKIPGQDQETKNIILTNTTNQRSCFAPLKFSLTASQPTTTPPGSEIPSNPGGSKPFAAPDFLNYNPVTTAPVLLKNATGSPCSYSLSIGQLRSISGQDGLQTAIGCVPTKSDHLVIALFLFVLGIGGGIAFLLMLVATFGMITSAGNPDSLRNAHGMFTNAVIGILFIVFSVLFLQIIGVDILGIKEFTP